MMNIKKYTFAANKQDKYLENISVWERSLTEEEKTTLLNNNYNVIIEFDNFNELNDEGIDGDYIHRLMKSVNID